jgi:hypothetical protein
MICTVKDYSKDIDSLNAIHWNLRPLTGGPMQRKIGIVGPMQRKIGEKNKNTPPRKLKL